MRVVLALLSVPAALAAQVVTPEPAQQIAAAVSVLPEESRAGATVLG